MSTIHLLATLVALCVAAPTAASEPPAKTPATKPATKPTAEKPVAEKPKASTTKPKSGGFDFATVVKKAERLAAASWQADTSVPDWLLKISYDQWRDIRFKADQAIWREQKLPFQVQFFHPGLFYNRALKINVVEDGNVVPIRFTPNMFDYGRNDFASRVPQDLGFAGFRLHHPIKTKEYYDEVIVFLGATYFRSLGRDQVFGLSARGLAIDTAESWGEEFPAFREFWLEQPAADAKSITVFALMDSPRATGAYKFVVTPGEETITQVEMQLFLRKEIVKIGIAPMTSMFFHGENTNRWFDDFRPEVHDSDGLVVKYASGEWLWRPLDNPKTLSLSGLAAESPAGFGLVQRDREFASYQDLETNADKRPSAWVEPSAPWGKGRIEVIEIPTNDELNDNIVAFWVPEEKAKPGTPLSLGYTVTWYGESAARPAGGRVLATRRDRGTIEGAHRFVIDFVGKELNAIPGDQVVRAVVSVGGNEVAGEIADQHVVKNPYTGGWRLTFQVVPKQREPIELRAYLDQGTTVLSETWSYALHP
jgi:glucans biosynthesis protein